MMQADGKVEDAGGARIGQREVAIERLRARVDNPNVMPKEARGKLKEHMERTGRYPAIIVRPVMKGEADDDHESEQYEILDGHHRVEILTELGYTRARCEVWEGVDDGEAMVLLATLNRLAGRDDVLKRAELLKKLRAHFDGAVGRLARMLPEDEKQIGRLLETLEPAPLPAEAPDLAQMPQALTFFLTVAEVEQVNRKLAQFEGVSRSARLLQALGLG